MGLIDSHAHLTYPGLYERMGEVLRAAEAAGVEEIITIGTDLEESRKAVDLAGEHPGRIRAAVGFHPHNADKVSAADIEELDKGYLRLPNVVAFGEMGLDYHYGFGARDRQHELFRAQLRIGAGLDLPIIIHSREACDDTIALLMEHGFERRRVVFHCFTGTADEARKIADRGWRISFTGIVTFKGSTELQAIARAYPREAIMVETDSPYLSPEPVRRVRTNEPAHVAHTARFLAELRGEPYDDFVRLTNDNTRTFFGLGAPSPRE
jgi:TatD DNase family protein